MDNDSLIATKTVLSSLKTGIKDKPWVRPHSFDTEIVEVHVGDHFVYPNGQHDWTGHHRKYQIPIEDFIAWVEGNKQWQQ